MAVEEINKAKQARDVQRILNLVFQAYELIGDSSSLDVLSDEDNRLLSDAQDSLYETRSRLRVLLRKLKD